MGGGRIVVNGVVVGVSNEVGRIKSRSSKRRSVAKRGEGRKGGRGV